MGAVRRTIALCAAGLVATIGSGCGTSSPLTERARDVPRHVPASLDRRGPDWLTAGSAPLPADAPDAGGASVPKWRPAVGPDPVGTAPARVDLAQYTRIEDVPSAHLPAQPEPISLVPRVEELREPANNSTDKVGGLVPPARPITVPATAEPQWRPAGGSRSP
jgi:hypothetical protein